MTVKEFKKSYLVQELGLPDGSSDKVRVISSDEIRVKKSRWSIHHDLIVQIEDQIGTDEAWCFSYSVGATEYQDESPWEFEDNIEGVLVKKTTKTVDVWE